MLNNTDEVLDVLNVSIIIMFVLKNGIYNNEEIITTKGRKNK